jgi:hypothetical protein
MLAAGVAVASAAGVAAYGLDLGDEPQSAATGLPPATATVTRTTLVETEKVNGTLGYGPATTVTGRTPGTITWLAPEGTTVDRGGAVYRRDDAAVPLLFGALPLYRPLRSGVDGSDVRQLEENLKALGYSGFTVDDSFTSSTADAVRRWQEDLGRPKSGRIDPGDVVVAAGPVRVQKHLVAGGDAATGPLLRYTATTRRVDIDLDVAKQHLVRPGVSATVTLPDDSTVVGTVTEVGTVATTAGSGAQATTTVPVTVTIADQAALGTLDAAPVSVTLVSQRKPDVLTVPVAALVALAEGGYGVQVVRDGTTSYVAVTTGLFADGRVEVSGDGIAEGTMVGMPS